MTKRLLFQTALLMLSMTAWAQGPNGSGTYYQNANGYTGAELKTALCEIINPHTQRSYNQLWSDFEKTDKKPNGKVWDMYSNKREFTFGTDQAGSYSAEGDVYNREHSFPKSWFNEDYPPYSDLYHMYPTDGWVNGMRGNDPFGEVGTSYTGSNGDFSKWGQARSGLGYSGKVFEPNDEYKGDFARTYFYMVTCYETYKNSNSQTRQITSWNSPMLDGKTYPGFTSWALEMLMRWSKDDPVSEKELNRIAAVYDIQKNRNPFIDYPGLEDYIWGDLKGQPFSYDNYGGDASFVAMPTFLPDAGSYYDQVEVTINCATDGAAIYYTTDGSNPTANSLQYSSPFMLTETATVKAIAMTGDGQSAVASATYIIKTSGGEQGEGVAQLNNSFFGVTETGTIAKSNTTDFVGMVGGATVTYALGSGGQRYVGTDHIRVYAGNEVKVSVPSGTLTSIQFEEKDNSGKALQATTGTVSGLTWTGDASQVTFTVSSGSGHMKMTSISVTTSGGTGIDYVLKPLSGQRVVYNLRGERVANPTRGLYIVDGKKVLIP